MPDSLFDRDLTVVCHELCLAICPIPLHGGGHHADSQACDQQRKGQASNGFAGCKMIKATLPKQTTTICLGYLNAFVLWNRTLRQDISKRLLQLFDLLKHRSTSCSRKIPEKPHPFWCFCLQSPPFSKMMKIHSFKRDLTFPWRTTSGFP